MKINREETKDTKKPEILRVLRFFAVDFPQERFTPYGNALKK